MNKNDWNNLYNWLKAKNFELQLDPHPYKFTNGMGNLNFKIRNTELKFDSRKLMKTENENGI